MNWWRPINILAELILLVYWIFIAAVLLYDKVKNGVTGISWIDTEMNLTVFAPMVILTLILLLSRRRYY